MVMMSRLRSKPALLLTLLASILSSTSFGVQNLGADPTWNYLQHGADWDFPSCNDTSLGQAPLSLDTSATGGMYDWTSFGKVGWLTAWETANIANTDYGVTNYTYRINATDGNMGSVYLTEPFAAQIQILYQVEQIRFKYPSEHKIDGKQYDLEMQVMLNDTYGLSSWCKSYKGGFSFFFDVDTSDQPTQSAFWDWVGKDTLSIDLNQVFSKTSGMDTQIFGYMGTETEPNCMNLFCWYMNLPAGKIL